MTVSYHPEQKVQKMKKLLLIRTLIILNTNFTNAEINIPDCECNKIKNNTTIEKKAELTPNTNQSINYEAKTSEKTKTQEINTKTKKSWWRFW